MLGQEGFNMKRSCAFSSRRDLHSVSSVWETLRDPVNNHQQARGELYISIVKTL
jgi:hypothetical protein